jgi:hypothetical protein
MALAKRACCCLAAVSRNQTDRSEPSFLFSCLALELGCFAAQTFDIGYFLAKLPKLTLKCAPSLIKQAQISLRIIDWGEIDRLRHGRLLEESEDCVRVLRFEQQRAC